MPKPQAGAEARLRKLLAFQSVLARVSRELGPATDLDIVLKSVLAAMRSLVEFRGGTIQLVDGKLIRVAASDPPISEEVSNSRVRIGEGISGRVVRDQRTIYVPDVDLDPRIDRALRQRGSNATMRSYLATPLVCLGETIGLLQVDSEQQDAFDDEDLTVLEGLAAQVAGAIESARRYEAMRELDHLRNDFVARVSHELRTPVAIVSGFVETLLAEGEVFDEAQRAHMLERIAAAIARLASLVERMVVVTTVEAGGVKPAPEPTDIRSLLQTVADEAADPKSVTVFCAEGIQRLVDPKLVRQTLGLLVDNALAFAGDAELIGDAAGVTVRDHGPGIDEAVRRHVFERFTRGEVSGPGLGIGLDLARTLTQVLGGDLDLVEPPDGEGTAFRLSFPPERRRSARRT